MADRAPADSKFILFFRSESGGTFNINHWQQQDVVVLDVDVDAVAVVAAVDVVATKRPNGKLQSVREKKKKDTNGRPWIGFPLPNSVVS